MEKNYLNEIINYINDAYSFNKTFILKDYSRSIDFNESSKSFIKEDEIIKSVVSEDEKIDSPFYQVEVYGMAENNSKYTLFMFSSLLFEDKKNRIY